MAKRKTEPKSEPKAGQIVGQVPVVVLTVDTLMNLINRVNALEGRVSSIADEMQENFDCSIEYAARLEKDGSIVINAMTDDEAQDVVLARGERAIAG